MAALGVEAIELVGDLARADLVGGQQQLEPGVGALEPAGGVDPRREPEADGGRVDPRRVGAGDAHQGAQAGALRDRERAQPGAHEPPVLAAQRDAVGDRRERHEVEVDVGERRIATGGLQQRGRQLVGDAGCAEIDARVAADRGMDDRRVGQHAVGARAVVIGDDDLDPRRPCGRDLVDGGDRAVGGDQQTRAARREPLHGRARQAVAVLRPAGQKPVGVGAERAQQPDEDRRRADAVDVVVAVDRDPPAGPHVVEHKRADIVDAGERGGFVTLVGCEPGACGTGVLQAAAYEHLRERVADPELAFEREHGGDVAGGDQQSSGRRRHGVDATAGARRNRGNGQVVTNLRARSDTPR